MKFRTSKTFTISFLMCSSILWGNAVLQAVGGEAEKISVEEAKNRGVLKIKGDLMCSTAVLLKEGKGQLGLGSKHGFEGKKTIAYLGEEERKVIKTYAPSNDEIDLVLFVLESPFGESAGFPQLPTTDLPDTLCYAGWFYGYGASTQPDLFPTEKRDNICRKGKIFAAHYEHIDSYNEFFPPVERQKTARFASEFTGSVRNDDLFSFFTFPQENPSGKTKSNSLKTDETNKLDAIILEHQSLPLQNKHSLMPSPAFSLSGDSGGPLISQDNQLYGIVVWTRQRGMDEIKIANPDTVVEKQYQEVFYDGEDVTCGFVRGEDALYIGSKLPSGKFLEQLAEESAANYREALELYLSGKGDKNNIFFHITEKEKKNSATPPLVTEWIQKNRYYCISAFVSIVCQQEWVARAMKKAFEYLSSISSVAKQ